MQRRSLKESLKTDYEILNCIYESYYSEYAAFQNGDRSRAAKMYVPIDIDLMATKLDMEGDLLFSRLYSFLNDRYGVNSEMKSPLFSLRVQDDIHCVHFPLLASILADLKYKRRQANWTRWLSVTAILISGVSLIVSIIRKSGSCPFNH